VVLPKVHRLRQRQNFTAVYQKGGRYRTKHLTLRALRQAKLSRTSCRAPLSGTEALTATGPRSPLPTRIGIAISQKVSKRAVVRNRIKRQLRACLRQLLPQLSAGWDLVIIVHPQAVQCDYFQFLQELEQLLLDSEVLNGDS
jgi:ribonuclease P protein component